MRLTKELPKSLLFLIFYIKVYFLYVVLNFLFDLLSTIVMTMQMTLMTIMLYITPNPTKFEGPDRIPPRVLHELQKFLYILLTILFNNSMEKGSIPCDWKNAEITAIKKGNKCNPASYRPISITSAVGSFLESIIRDIIVAYMNDYDLCSDCQHGFRKHTSCVTQFLRVVEDLSDMFDNGDPFDIIYLDLRKAFDQVSHRRLAV